MTDDTIIYCDAASHGGRRYVVTKFRASTGMLAGHWSEIPATRAVSRIGSAVPLVGDVVPEPGWVNDPDYIEGTTRTRFELACRRCLRSKPLQLRAETLFAALDALRGAGVSSVSLSGLGAIVQEMARTRVSRPPSRGRANPGN